MKPNNEEHMSWQQFEFACREIRYRIKQIPTISFKNIYGIPRGGLPIAVRLSVLLDLPLITDNKLVDEKTLVVDDISDTGKTLSFYHGKNFIATLYYHAQTISVPSISIFQKKDKWIIFPWEEVD